MPVNKLANWYARSGDIRIRCATADPLSGIDLDTAITR